MNILGITSALNGTLFADDYRTNLDEAFETIRALETRVNASHDSSYETPPLLLQAVFSSICGNFGDSNECLDQLMAMEDSRADKSLVMRCNAYRVFIQSMADVPPSLRFCNDSGTGPAMVRAVGHSSLRARLFRQLDEGAANELSFHEKLELKVLRSSTAFLQELWLAALPEHPLVSKGHPFVLFRSNQSFREDVGGLDELPGLADYFDFMTLQYLFAANASGARDALLKVYNDANEKGNMTTAANCQLRLGDAIVSPPFTSPFALNLVTVANGIGWVSDEWDTKESQFFLTPDDEALRCYQKAHFLFEASGSNRGMAAVLLRHACFDLAQALLEHPDSSSRPTADLVETAWNNLNGSKLLFKGDVTNTIIVNAHLAICDVLRQNFAAALKLCFTNGSFAKCKGNASAGGFVGFLLLRLARRMTLSGNHKNLVLPFCASAKALFKGMDNPYLELHAVAACAIFHQQNGDTYFARRHVERGRALRGLTLAYFNGLQDEIQSLRKDYGDQEQSWLDHDMHMLESKCTMCVMDFNRIADEVDVYRPSNQRTVLSPTKQQSHPIIASPIATFLRSGLLTSGLVSGLDESLKPALQSLASDVEDIDSLRESYEETMQHRRDELIQHSDIDAAETHLRDLLERLRQSPIFSEELETMKVAILQYLGDFDEARSVILRTLPESFGGARASILPPAGVQQNGEDMMERYERHKYKRALSLCFAAKDWRRGMSGIQNMLRWNPETLDEMKRSEDPHVWEDMVRTATILEQNQDFITAFDCYLNAFLKVETRRYQLADTEDRRGLLSTMHSGELFFGLARIALHYSNSIDAICGPSEEWQLTLSVWKDQCLRFLELGRSRMLLDILESQQQVPHKVLAWSKGSYDLRGEQVEDSHDSTTAESTRLPTEKGLDSQDIYLSNLETDLLEEMAPIRLPQLAPQVADVTELNSRLYCCIPQDAIVLHINSGREGVLILCITTQGIIDIHLSDVTGLDLDRHILRFAKLFNRLDFALPADLPPVGDCDRLLLEISRIIIEPISRHIECKDHVIFAPSPSLNRFPLSALFYEDKPLFLSKDVSQVLSLSILRHLVEKEHRYANKINVVYHDPEFAGEPLDFSTAAATTIARSYSVEPQPASKNLSKSEFAATYKHSDVLLVATHGETSNISAWDSFLLVLEDSLKVRDLAKMHTNASLVVFEACVSGAGEESIGNDLLGFSHAVLASGATAFVGGLWNVSDEASALLMRFFFKELKRNKEGKSLARCWRNAQTRLYNLDTAGAVAILKDLRKNCIGACKPTLRLAIEDIRESGVSYLHPFYWAPFFMMGYGGKVLLSR